MIRAPLLFIAGSLMVVAGFCICGAAPKSTQQSSEIEQIRQDIESLRRRVESLEQHLQDHFTIIPGDHKKEPMIAEPWFWPHQEQKDWKRFRFNGMNFYVIPLGNTPPPAHENSK
jgi:hypothetical protein